MIYEFRISSVFWQGDMQKQKILPEFQGYLLERRLAADENIPFYAWWARRFLTYNNRHEDLLLDETFRRAGIIRDNSHSFQARHVMQCGIVR
jgi:hypothetical protein